jgi:SAM-dependent methyltransferase
MRELLGRMIRYADGLTVVEDEVNRDKVRSQDDQISFYGLYHARRLAYSLSLIKQWLPQQEGTLRILEVGSAPFFFSYALTQELPCELVGVDTALGAWPGPPQEAPRTPNRVRLAARGEVVLDMPVYVFNIERDIFPFDDDSFDMILYMEVMEHLAYSPSWALAEMHRVLRPQGRLFLTVPNYLSFTRLWLQLMHLSDEHPYSGLGIYGRHLREFTLEEVGLLLKSCNYNLLHAEHANVYPWVPPISLQMRVVRSLTHVLQEFVPYFQRKREYILTVSEKVGEPRVGLPSWLYNFRDLYPIPPYASKGMD